MMGYQSKLAKLQISMYRRKASFSVKNKKNIKMSKRRNVKPYVLWKIRKILRFYSDGLAYKVVKLKKSMRRNALKNARMQNYFVEYTLKNMLSWSIDWRHYNRPIKRKYIQGNTTFQSIGKTENTICALSEERLRYPLHTTYFVPGEMYLANDQILTQLLTDLLVWILNVQTSKMLVFSQQPQMLESRY